MAQTSLTGSSLALKSTGSAALGSNGYVGTYLVVPAGGATVNFTTTATASLGVTAAPHMNLVVADTVAGFTVANASATPYTTPDVTLPAGTYFIRNERDYSGNVGVSRSFSVNNLAVNTVSGPAATFSNASNDTNARNAANTYIDNFRKGNATVALSGPGNIPLLAGTPIQADLGRRAFNFGNAVSGNTSTQVNSYLGNNGTTLQTNYQSRLNQNFNALVPGNAGKWQNNEFTRDVVTMSGVDQILNYAQSHNMRARMHNLIWGKNSFNGQQPNWVLNNSNTGLLDEALAGNTTARDELRAEITERIAYYLNPTRAPRIVELDVYNESFHEPEYRTALGFDNVDGLASIYTEAANAAAAAGATTRMFTNEYNVFQDGGDAWANWYRNEIESIRNAGGNVGGVGMQYYPNQTIGTGNNQHSTARMMAVLNNMSVQGLPISLTEFGVKAGGEAIAPTVLEDSMHLTFGSPNATGFMMWGFWAGEGLFAPGSAMYDANWNITDSGKKWQDLLGIVDWDANPNNAWDTDVATTVNADGTITFNGFYGDYYLRGQTSGAFDLTMSKGTTGYTAAMAAPPTWSLWNSAGSGNWSTGGNWTAGGSANAAGQTAYFGNAAAHRTVTVDAPKTVGIIALDSAAGYTISGTSTITLKGFDNGAGRRAVVHVAAGSNTIAAPVVLADDTTVHTAGSLTVSGSLNNTVGKMLDKTGAGVLNITGPQTHGAGAAFNASGGTTNFHTDAGSASSASLAVNVEAGAVVNFNAIQHLAAVTVRGGIDIGVNDVSVANALVLESGAIDGTTGIVTAGSYTVQSGSTSAGLSGPGALTKSTAGTVTLSGNNSYTGGTTVQAGTLQVTRLQQNNAVTITGGTMRVLESTPGLGSGHPAGHDARVSLPSSLSISGGATLDLTNNDLILDYSGASPVAAYEVLVASGYNVTGDWTGTGITSSVAALDGNYVVAIADNALLPAPFGTAQGGPLFAGVDVDLTTVLVKFTHRADINLDGVVTPDDSAIFGGNYDENQPATWATGDMNYDGVFTPDDAAIFGGSYDESLASLPEPGSLVLPGLLCMALACRRRSRHSQGL